MARWIFFVSYMFLEMLILFELFKNNRKIGGHLGFKTWKKNILSWWKWSQHPGFLPNYTCTRTHALARKGTILNSVPTCIGNRTLIQNVDMRTYTYKNGNRHGAYSVITFQGQWHGCKNTYMLAFTHASTNTHLSSQLYSCVHQKYFWLSLERPREWNIRFVTSIPSSISFTRTFER